MKILVTGSNGLLGQKLIGLLTQKGIHTIGCSRQEDSVSDHGELFEYLTLDITDQKSVNRIVSETNPDVVINSAAMTAVDQCESDQEGCRKANVDAVSYLVEACEANDIFFLQVSTDFIFDGKDGPYLEEATANPVNFYGQSKLDAEAVVKKSKLKWAIARTVLVYGVSPGLSRSNIILWVKKSLEEGKTINVVDDQWRTPTLAEDLAMGCYLIANQRAEGIFNISGSEMLTPYDMAMATADFYGLDKGLINRADASTFSQPAKRPPKTGFVIDKAKSKLGYQPRSFAEGIQVMNSQLPTEA